MGGHGIAEGSTWNGMVVVYGESNNPYMEALIKAIEAAREAREGIAVGLDDDEEHISEWTYTDEFGVTEAEHTALDELIIANKFNDNGVKLGNKYV